MNETQANLLEFTRKKALPYLINHPKFIDYKDKLSFILVGSVATGLCKEGSDVDIAVICDEELYRKISVETMWSDGIPSEEIINDIQLHYYGMPFSKIEEKFAELDDSYLYVYSNYIALHDPTNLFTNWMKSKSSKTPEVRRTRLEGKLDMLLRRRNALTYCIENNEDILGIAEIYFEVIKLSLKVTALLDYIDFEPRKRLFNTAVSGKKGRILEGKIRNLFYHMGLVGIAKEKIKLPTELDEIIDTLCLEARKQGFRVGLERPDRRHVEY